VKSGEVYLGDGLYASFDGLADQIKLRAPRLDGDHVVYLEREVFVLFIKFAETCFPSLIHNPEKDSSQ
jgi:hypothetical protein